MTHPDELTLRSRLILVLAVAALALATLWAVRTPPAPNSDRYDYAGRAYHAIQGEGLRAHVVYPLRIALPHQPSFPPENLSRPPLWPILLIPLQQAGLDDRAGVVLAGVLVLPLILLVRRVGDGSFGSSAGGLAALAVVSSFATVRAIWGGGPEVLLALLTFLLWTWTPAFQGTAGYLACGSVYGVLPLLHPAGWMYAGLAYIARSHRYSATGRALVLVSGLLVASPWYVKWWAATGEPTGFVQGQAELAKAMYDPGGLGPYRTLEPVHTREVLQNDLPAVLKTVGSRLKHRLLHLDALLGWGMILLACFGAPRDGPLARRDALLVGLGFLALAPISGESRLALPLVPVMAVWCGAGYRRLADRAPRAPWLVLAAVVTALPWVLPLGQALRPAAELRNMPMELRDPSRESIERIGAAGDPSQPMFTDSSVLAWRSRRPAIFLPDTPETLDRIRQRPHLADINIVVLGRGLASRWLLTDAPAWKKRITSAGSMTRLEGGPLIVEWDRPPPPVPTVPQEPVDARHRLAADDVPPALAEIPLPLATREGLLLRPEALDALLEMAKVAAEVGVHLRVVSAYRSFEYQAQLYDNALQRHGPDQQWVARPGESEHQLGTAVDVADEAMQHALEPSFADTREGQWLRGNVHKFGFVITYTEATVQSSGILPEPWHIRYLGNTVRR